MPVLNQRTLQDFESEGEDALPDMEAPRGPLPPQPLRGMEHHETVTDSELQAIASQMEAEEIDRAYREQLARDEEEARQSLADAELFEEVEAARYREWEDWAVHDEMYCPKKQRTMLKMEVNQQTSMGHSTLGEFSVPLHSLSNGQVNIRLSLQTEETMVAADTLPTGQEQGDCKGSSWNDITAMGPEGLQSLYLSWRQGLGFYVDRFKAFGHLG